MRKFLGDDGFVFPIKKPVPLIRRLNPIILENSLNLRVPRMVFVKK